MTDHKFEILDITYRNGERHQLDYDYRKKKFQNQKDMNSYKKNLEKKLGRELFLMYKQF